MTTTTRPLMAKAYNQLARLNAAGWTLQAWDVDREFGYLLVDGTDNYGDRVRGRIDSAGDFSGEVGDD